MRKAIMMLVACVAVASLVAAPGAGAKKKSKAPRVVGGTVTLVAASPAAGVNSTTATGNVQSQSSCRKGRTVRLTLSDATGTPSGSEVVAVTGSNGDYSATVATPTVPGTYTLKAAVDQLYRKSGKGKKAKKIICSALTATPVTVTVAAPPVI